MIVDPIADLRKQWSIVQDAMTYQLEGGARINTDDNPNDATIDLAIELSKLQTMVLGCYMS